MKNISLKSVILITGALVFSLLSFGQGSANFSGTWAFNESKSNIGEGGGRMVSPVIIIVQDATSFSMERTFTGQDGTERKMTEKYTMDGKESVNPVFNTQKKSKAVWSADQKVFTVTSVLLFEMNGETNEIKTTEVYKLSGNEMTIDSQSTTSRGERKATLVYTKK